MEDEEMGSDQQVQDDRVADATTGSAWVRRHVSDSIYLWACGEKANDGDEDLTFTERLIGWLILFLQGFAYAGLMFRAARSSDSDSTDFDDNDDSVSGYPMASVTGAMYLLVASTTPDLRAGFSLLVDGFSAGQRVFGLGLLVVYGLMISAATTVLVSQSDDDISVVLNAVTVLFIADLDEKTLKLFMTVPKKWRLFWTIQSIAISFALALVAVFYIGDASDLLEQYNDDFEFFPSWFFLAVNPGAVTLSSFFLSAVLEKTFRWCSEACQKVDKITIGFVVSSGRKGFWGIVKAANECIREEPRFYVVVGLWLAQGVLSWWVLSRFYGFPVFADLPIYNRDSGGDNNDRLEISDNQGAFLFSNVVLALGVAMRAFGAMFPPPRERLGVIPEPCYTSDRDAGERKKRCLRSCLDSPVPPVPSVFLSGRDGRERKQCCFRCCSDSRVPSVLIGWGVGYWVTSVWYVLAGSWPEGGWDSAPTAVVVVASIILPCFFLAVVFTMANTNFFGTRFGSFIKPAVDVMVTRRGIVYWVLVTVLRDALLMWALLLYVFVRII